MAAEKHSLQQGQRHPAHHHDHVHLPGDGHDHAHSNGAAHHHSHSGWLGDKTELICALICGAFLLAGFLVEKFTSLPYAVALGGYIASYLFGGFFTGKEAIEGIVKKQFEIDFLMLVAAAGAAALGEWPEGALLLFLFSLGHSLEHMAMEKARKSIESLASLAPKTAIVNRNNQQMEILVDQLVKGDLVVVKPNSKIPADGRVVEGNSSVNQAPITGESIPVDKAPGDKVYAGTINGAGVLTIQTEREAKDFTLARVVQMVREAEKQQSPTQQFTKKIERYYVPAVLILVVLLLFAFLVVNETFSQSFYRAMAVLVAASPCALAISTPSAVLSGVARAARQGVLIKGGRPLEDLGMLTAIAFDKTGTLTEGKPQLTAIVPLNGTDENTLLQTAAAVEKLSDHPLAAAVVRGAAASIPHANLSTATNLRSVMGKGIAATYEGSTIIIGNDEMFAQQGKLPVEVQQPLAQLQLAGNTTMMVQRDGTFMGIIGLMDTPRAEAAGVLQKLKAKGIRKMIMLTGDNQRVGDAIAKSIGLTEVKGDLLPEEKVAAIDALREQEKSIAMVGDGVNDAPAMAKSTVGIAMGAAGSDVALETADIALMADKLDNLVFAIGLSRKSKSIIRQNLVISLGMVAILVPLTILGIANIGPAVAAHEGSTLVVVFNALRLLAYRD